MQCDSEASPSRDRRRVRETLRLANTLSRKIGNARMTWDEAARALGVEREKLARTLVDPARQSPERLRELIQRLAG